VGVCRACLVTAKGEPITLPANLFQSSTAKKRDYTMDFAKLIERAKNICLSPQTEWPKIAEESETTQSLYINYAMILAAIPAIALIVGSLGRGASIGIAIVTYVLSLIVIFIASLIINALAPTFDGTKNPVNALKVAVYSMTPGWLAGVFNVVPMIGGVIVLLASLYGIYLFYLGLSPNMKNPHEKSIGYTALVIVCYIVMWMVFSFLMMSVLFGGAMMGASMFR
jgi:Yip1 domain